MWLEHRDAARFDRLKFKPLPEGVCEKRQKVCDYNLWKGFKVLLTDGDKYVQRAGREQCVQQLRPFMEHVMHVWCRGEANLYDYVLNWMAWCFQKPDKKTEVAIAIRGDKGSGKGVIMQMLGKIYGREYFFHAQKADDLVGSFNDHLQTCMLCFVDEVTFANDTAATNILKTLVTEQHTTINTKFKSRFQLQSYMNLFLAGNLAKIVECEGTERRYLVLETNDKWSGSQSHQSAQYFRRLTSVPLELLRYFFSRRDISEFNPKEVPSSAAMRDQKILSLGVIEGWLHRCLVRGRILDFTAASQSPPKLVAKSAERTVTVASAATDADVDAAGAAQMTDAQVLDAQWQEPMRKDHIYSAFLQNTKELGNKAKSDSAFWKGLLKIFRPRGSPKSMLEDGASRTRIEAQLPPNKSGAGVAKTKDSSCRVQKQMMAFPSLEVSRRLFRENVTRESTWSFDEQGETVVQDENAQYSDEQLGLRQVFE
jgi:hypothetical protein